jgi:hypothetical protein
MESIISTILIPDRFRDYKRLYSIKNLIIGIRDILGWSRESETCKMCFLYNNRGRLLDDDSDIDDDDRVKFINRNGDHYTWNDLCHQCNGSDNADYLDKLLLLAYGEKRDRLNEIISLFRVKFPYDILLKECECYGFIHRHCPHYNRGNKELCPIIIELIGKMADIKSSYWISSYDIKYIDYFLAKGCKIDLPKIIDDYIRVGNSVKRIEKVISYCSDEEKIIKLTTKTNNKLLMKRKINRLKLLGIKIIP